MNSNNSATISSREADAAARQSALLLVLNEQVDAAASKVQLLANMGLTHTTGYAEARAAYNAKLGALNELRASLGL